ncbi:MAG: hypothetical protein ABIQ70_06000 [Dokdonella sp.]
MKSSQKVNEVASVAAAQAVRPLGRLTAREISAEELAKISGGYATPGISNSPGGDGDRDMIN